MSNLLYIKISCSPEVFPMVCVLNKWCFGKKSEFSMKIKTSAMLS